MLRSLLDNSIRSIGTLDGLLHEERRALEAQDPESLHSVAIKKETCISRLEALEVERDTLCASVGFNVGEDGMPDLLDWCGRDSGTTELWNKLLMDAGRCEALNRTNGAISRVRFEHVASALAAINGAGAEQTYGMSGQPSGRSGHRELASV